MKLPLVALGLIGTAGALIAPGPVVAMAAGAITGYLASYQVRHQPIRLANTAVGAIAGLEVHTTFVERRRRKELDQAQETQEVPIVQQASPPPFKNTLTFQVDSLQEPNCACLKAFHNNQMVTFKSLSSEQLDKIPEYPSTFMLDALGDRLIMTITPKSRYRHLLVCLLNRQAELINHDGPPSSSCPDKSVFNFYPPGESLDFVNLEITSELMALPVMAHPNVIKTLHAQSVQELLKEGWVISFEVDPNGFFTASVHDHTILGPSNALRIQILQKLADGYYQQGSGLTRVGYAYDGQYSRFRLTPLPCGAECEPRPVATISPPIRS